MATTLNNKDAGFGELRNKIHGRPEPSDAQRVREYARSRGKPELAEEYEALAAAIDSVAALPDPGPAVLAYAGKVRDQSLASDLLKRTLLIKQTLHQSTGTSPELAAKIAEVEKELEEILWSFHGQDPPASREENWPAAPSLMDRFREIIWAQWQSTSSVTKTQQDQLALLEEEFPPVLARLKQIHEVKLVEIQQEMDRMNAPWTPGRTPTWDKE